MSKSANNRDEEILQEVSKASNMGMEEIAKLLPKVEGQPLKNALSAQLKAYQGFSSRAADLLSQRNKSPQSAGLFEKMPAEMGIAFSTVIDSSDQKIAQLMINGYVTGITDMKKQLADAQGAPEDTLKLAGDLLAFQSQSIVDIKEFL